jgi:caa(3)-type oxidase subunit IV
MSEEHHVNYVKIWLILLGLLVVSVVGPMVGIQWLTLVTAFGIAVVKAVLVARNFMHINLEKKFITYAVMTCLVLMFLFFAGTAPDVMKDSGTGWEKDAETWNPTVAVTHEEHGGEHH